MPFSKNTLKHLIDFFMWLSCVPVGYTSKDLIYAWNPKRNVVIARGLRMSQFDLIDVPVHQYNSPIVETCKLCLFHSSKIWQLATEVDITRKAKILSLRC